MQFDIFHSLGRIDSVKPLRNDRQVYTDFLSQVKSAESMGYDTIWVAESHFSSQVQKEHPHPVIPNYMGEVGLNCDMGQLAQWIFANTQTINFGTAIHNIVGGNGGPIASADKMTTLAFLNGLQANPRKLFYGVASGRFPYINEPFGIKPRDEGESVLWPLYKRIIFIEALEIFLRLMKGESVGHKDLSSLELRPDMFVDTVQYEDALRRLGASELPSYRRRWEFEKLKIVPELDEQGQKRMQIVLGSHDPLAQERGFKFWNMDLFNLSFTPSEKLNQVHSAMDQKLQASDYRWHRGRMPRTVLIFIDPDSNIAMERASSCFDTYIEAMRGTVGFPPKDVLMSRALIGTPDMIREQLQAGGRFGFEEGDRLMLWFEFNQGDSSEIQSQMKLFADEVMAKR